MTFKTNSTLIIALFFLAVISLMPSCKKTGPQGIPGAQGDQGVAGPAGADGSVIYSGNGTPASTIGQNGDYYLDKNTGNLYGPKTTNGWGIPILLNGGQGSSGAQGPQGPPGANGATGSTGAAGSQIYSGNDVPSVSLGTNGDYYLDKTSYLLYGPKTANGWGTATLLRGAQGPQGPAGPAGVAGSQIYSGTGVPAAALGKTGDYYLDKSNVNFYGPKTANGWGTPVSLNGGTGAQGPGGPQGPQGPPGANGATGATGAAGAAGSQIYSGIGTPPAATGKTGDYFIDDMHAVIYGPKMASGWPATGLSLQVNNTITYDFINKPQYNLPYNWFFPDGNAAIGTDNQPYIYLPYNSSSYQTQGFTIPQNIVDNGIVLSYIRYFNSAPSDTATSAGMSAWSQMPYSMAYYNTYQNNNSQTSIHIETSVATNGFGILLSEADGNPPYGFANSYIPAVIRIVLIPGNQINTIQKFDPNLEQQGK